MINKIQIQNIATCPETVTKVENLKKVNFFFGSNGSGKTTISKIIAKDDDFDACTLHWDNNLQLERRVYNKDFFDNNFKSDYREIIF